MFQNKGKDNCFKRIASRFGDKCTYVVVGHKTDDEMAAKQVATCTSTSVY